MVRQNGKGRPATFDEWMQSAHAKQRIAVGDTGAVDEARRWYSHQKGPSDTVEKTRPYYRNPKKETDASRWFHRNAGSLLKTTFSGVGGILGGPLGAVAGTALGAVVGKTLEDANQEGGGFWENVGAVARGVGQGLKDADRRKAKRIQMGGSFHGMRNEDWRTIPNLYPRAVLNERKHESH